MNGHFMKRQRGRGRKPGGGGGGGGGHQPNRTLESNGPDVKIRGSASHIYEKYVQLSRDAASAGDRVMSESYAQFAEHYFRMLRAMQPQTPVYEPQRFGQDLDYEQEGEDGEETAEGGEGETAEAGQGEQPYGQFRGGEPRQRFQPRHPYQQRGPRQPHEGQQQENYARPEGQQQGGEQAAAGGEGQPGEGQEFAGQDGFRGPRRRRHRGRFRPQDGRPDEGQNEGPVEGFGDSVPAFVGND